MEMNLQERRLADTAPSGGREVPPAGTGMPASAVWDRLSVKLQDVEFRRDEPLAAHTTFRVGGPVSCFAVPRTEEALTGLLREVRELGVPHVILGGGSNILAPDGPSDLLVVKLSPACSGAVRIEDAGEGRKRAYAGAGAGLSGFLGFCRKNGLGGLECLAGIPGTVGGALVMNAGTRDGCISDALIKVDVLDREGERRELEKAELPIAYRSLGLPEGCVVMGGHFLLEESAPSAIEARMADILRRRKLSQPQGFPSAGCVFKNPPGQSAGALIERAGLKGCRMGDAEVSEKHANWIVNRGNARAEDILALIRHVEDRIRREFGVSLEREIRMLTF